MTPVTMMGTWAFVMMASGRLVRIPTTMPASTGNIEGAFVLEKRPSCGLPFLRSDRLHQIFGAVPPQFGHSVIGIDLPTANPDRRRPHVRERVALGVTANPQCLCVLAHQPGMVLEPILLKL